MKCVILRQISELTLKQLKKLPIQNLKKFFKKLKFNKKNEEKLKITY